MSVWYSFSGRIEIGIFSPNEPKTLPVLSIRPTVAEHVLSVFGRSVHPELFLSYKTRTIQRSNYRARIDITSDGHLVSFTGTRGATLSEVVGSLQQSLPQQRKLLSTLMRGRYVEEVQGKRGLQYRSEFELEQVSAEMFWMLHNQFTTCCSQDELMHAFDSSGRFPFGGPLGRVRLASWAFEFAQACLESVQLSLEFADLFVERFDVFRG